MSIPAVVVVVSVVVLVAIVTGTTTTVDVDVVVVVVVVVMGWFWSSSLLLLLLAVLLLPRTVGRSVGRSVLIVPEVPMYVGVKQIQRERDVCHRLCVCCCCLLFPMHYGTHREPGLGRIGTYYVIRSSADMTS